ncbi:translation initiation factor IF-2 [Sphingobacterium sp. UT-1RO-CII-1]|uniref:translation initiation factor IF-2 n=1 Tax=Sphingobacterium sp. UT-1RO-CII-1 TaxID=2995225 RepID=UPI00227A5721|nr:translation initiation factor IF-2 [Sphingobacterium sp. UT-1RO-CII-1]MCY4779041.1 translation initiation factor IF-2 [Sphingobacterium sp. UT-1RO-CII-1]
MTEGKSVNLLKAAKELNIGIGTAVDFLEKKGFDVDSKPSTKLSPDMYAVLLKEFQGDKIVKDEAKQIVIGKIRREESAAGTGGAYPTESKEDAQQDIKEISEEAKAPVEEKPVKVKEEESEKVKEETKKEDFGALKVVGKIDLDNLGKNRTKKEEPKPEEKKVEEKKIKEEKAPEKQAVVETPKPTEEKKIEEVKPQEEVKPVVVEPKKEAPKVAVEVREEKVDVQPTKQEKKEEVKIEPKADMKKESTEVKQAVKEQKETPVAESQQDEVIRARSETLAGPKVVGRIQLPVERTNKPVASSSNASQHDNKRKRKRTNKPAPHTGTGATPAAGGQQRGPGGVNRGPAGDNRGGANRGPNRPGGPQDRFGKGRPDNRGRGRQADAPKEEPTEKEIQDQIKATLARLSGAGRSGKFAQRARLRRQKRDDVALSAEEAAMEEAAQSRILRVTEFVTANELANLMDVQVTQVISTCMSLGMFVSINQRLDAETLTIVADEFGYQVEFIKPEDEEITELEEPDNVDNLINRAPIVTVMGHVDHGKTSLLDYIRKAKVTKGEAGGITQHIGAYAVELEDNKRITFLDTPGHEAFTAMRARGAKVTDIVIIVIAADDAVMPQTKEAINHAQAAGVPIIFAFTKMDKPSANADRVREQLSAMNILVEDWGGKYQAQEISSKTGENINLLLEKVLLEAELLELKTDPKKRAVGSVIEAALDKGRGIVTTVLVQGGTLRIGDAILAGSHSGKVKALTNERGERVKEVGPSTPVQILGMSGAPTAGDKLYVMESESEARSVANKRLQLQREQGMRATKHITLDEIGRRLAIGNFKELNVIVKGDVDGSIEALSDSLLKLSTDEIQVNVIHKSVGAISESDVLLASASDAIIIGFQVRPTLNARKLAEQEMIDIRLYSIIYDAIEELKSAMEGMLAPKYEEKIVAEVEIRETFKISKVGTIAGCMVLSGKINRNNDIRIIREGVVIHTGKLASLKRFKDDVKEVSNGYECGLNIDRFNDIQVGDIVEAYEQVEIKRKL